MKELKTSYNAVELEERVRRWWQQNDIQSKVMGLQAGKPLFRFLEGPPTTNGFMHIGHARGRAMKDVVLRFETMRGKNVWRRAGWDCQGLPVEIEVEKNLKLTSKRGIEKVGVDNFVMECNKLVDYYIDHWRRNSERLGVWLDYDQAYETRKDEYIEFVWWFIKKAYEKGLLKEDLKVVPTCPRCETPLSSHEVSLGYATLRDPSVYVKFPLEGADKEYILIWTTTPWTIPGNEAVSVHPESDYARLKVGEETWVMADQLVEKVMVHLKVENYRKLGVVKGKELEGIKYAHPLIDETPLHKSHESRFDHSIICGEHVSLEEGTGCVHTSPAHGPEDFEVGNRYGLQVFCPIDQTGHFTQEAGKYAGKFFKSANPEIIRDLRRKGLLVWYREVEHEYPTCWRCGTPLLHRVDKQWFLKILPIRGRMLEENGKVEWFPEWAGKNRFGEWLAETEDWCISRSRVWGTPLNIWKCRGCGSIRVIGTMEELRKNAKKIPSHFELHRPWIDEVTLECEECRGEMVRVTFVLDCWLDSGVAHAASVNYLKNPELFHQLSPYDFITEAVDQTRGWFYSLLTTGVLLFDRSPYKRVLCQGHVVDKHGQKMSKSRGNVIWSEDALKEYGADLARAYLLLKVAPEDTLSFDYEELEQVKRTLAVVWNVFTFATTYMLLDAFEPEEWPLEKVEGHLKNEDRWLLSRCQHVIEDVTWNLENLRLHRALRTVLEFVVEDVSRFYLRLVRRRTWTEAREMEKTAAYTTLYKVLLETLKLMAPFTPHIVEELYQSVSGRESESIHMLNWPVANGKLTDKSLEKDIEICRETIKAVSAARQKGQVKLRWPVTMVTVTPLSLEVMEALQRQKEILLTQVNAKDVTVQKPGEKPPFLKTQLKPNHAELGQRLKSSASEVIAELGRMDMDELSKKILEEGEVELTVDGRKVRLGREDFTASEFIPDYVCSETFVHGTVFVDVTRTDRLVAEALAKEVVRRAQIMRKDMNLRIEEYVEASILCEKPETLELLKTMESYLMAEVRIRKLSLISQGELRATGKGMHIREWNVEDEKIKIMLERME